MNTQFYFRIMTSSGSNFPFFNSRWNISDFSTCSKSCGGGIQIRSVTCIQEVRHGGNNIKRVEDSFCPQPPPITQQLCSVVDCPVLQSIMGKVWSTQLKNYTLIIFLQNISHYIILYHIIFSFFSLFVESLFSSCTYIKNLFCKQGQKL